MDNMSGLGMMQHKASLIWLMIWNVLCVSKVLLQKDWPFCQSASVVMKCSPLSMPSFTAWLYIHCMNILKDTWSACFMDKSLSLKSALFVAM